MASTWSATTAAALLRRSTFGAFRTFFFDKKWAYWLRDTIPGAQQVVEVDDARLFFPEDRPDSLTQPMLRFWSNLSEA